MKLKKRTIEYNYEDDMPFSNFKTAIIIFTNFNNQWKLKKVDFKTDNNPYDYEDWQFLRRVANKIDELLKELNGE